MDLATTTSDGMSHEIVDTGVAAAAALIRSSEVPNLVEVDGAKPAANFKAKRRGGERGERERTFISSQNQNSCGIAQFPCDSTAFLLLLLNGIG